MTEAGEFAMYVAMGAGSLALFLGPVGQALGRRLAGKTTRAAGGGFSTGEMAAERVTDLESRVVDLEGAVARMAELEERVDFAERLLARGPGAVAVGPKEVEARSRLEGSG